VLCIVPIVIAVASFFINGTDYFIGGMLGLVSGPILYVFWKRRYGGLAKKGHPVNPRTGLALGDLRRIAGVFFGLAVVGFVAVPWLRWFEGSWAEEYYTETYGSGLLSNFDAMITGILIAAAVSLVVAVITWLVALKLEPKKGSQQTAA
jgi:hypothetical protein